MKRVLSDFSSELGHDEIITVSLEENFIELTFALNPEKVRFKTDSLPSGVYCKHNGHYILFYPVSSQQFEEEIIYERNCDKPQKILTNDFNNIEFVDYDPPIWHVKLREDNLDVYEFFISDSTKIKSYPK